MLQELLLGFRRVRSSPRGPGVTSTAFREEPAMNRCALVLLCSVTATLAAQQPAPTFEVASIKPNTNGISNTLPPSRSNGSYSASNVALKSVIANAYDARIFQIEGGPDWLTSERFDIIARGPEGTPDGLRPAMLRTLLAERFKLVAHFETREQQVYSLTLLRGDGRLGPQVKPSAPASGSSSGFPSASVGNGTARINGRRV